jgi:hypothetical protein
MSDFRLKKNAIMKAARTVAPKKQGFTADSDGSVDLDDMGMADAFLLSEGEQSEAQIQEDSYIEDDESSIDDDEEDDDEKQDAQIEKEQEAEKPPETEASPAAPETASPVDQKQATEA